MKNSNDTIRNRTHDLPNCNAVPQPTVPPRTPIVSLWVGKMQSVMEEALQILHSRFTEHMDTTSFITNHNRKVAWWQRNDAWPISFLPYRRARRLLHSAPCLGLFACSLERQGSVPGQFIWDLYDTKWPQDRVFSEYLGAALSVKCHHFFVIYSLPPL